MLQRTVRFLFLGALLLLSAATVSAQGNVLIQPQHSDPTWTAYYWDNMTFTGQPVLQRADAAINFNWGTGSPGTGVPADRFSVRWQRYIDVAAGTYRFTATSDDGIRVWVDDRLLIDSWRDQAPTTVAADRTLTAGHHLVRVDYYENGGGAVARLDYAPVDPPIVNWRGEYFNNTTLSGSPVLVRDDAAINFDWGTGAPAVQLPADLFSVRWTRTVTFEPGTYRFTLTVDDGARLTVNNHLLIDKWIVQAPTTYTADFYLPGGRTPLTLTYFENTGGATAKLSWARVTPPPGDGIIVDNTSPGFVTGGRAASWRTVQGGYGGNYLWTYNNDRVRPNYNWGRWYPDLDAGRYEVFVFIPARNATTDQARYWVSHRNGYTLVEIDQMAYADEWVSLGTYTFRGTSSDYVSLSDVTYEPYLSRRVAWDAARFVAR